MCNCLFRPRPRCFTWRQGRPQTVWRAKCGRPQAEVWLLVSPLALLTGLLEEGCKPALRWRARRGKT